MNIKLKMLLLGLTNLLSNSTKVAYYNPDSSYQEYNSNQNYPPHQNSNHYYIEEKKSSNTLYWVIGIGAIGLAGGAIWALSDDKKEKEEKSKKKEKAIQDLDEKINNEKDTSKKEKLIKEKEKIELELLESDKKDLIEFMIEDAKNDITTRQNMTSHEKNELIKEYTKNFNKMFETKDPFIITFINLKENIKMFNLGEDFLIKIKEKGNEFVAAGLKSLKLLNKTIPKINRIAKTYNLDPLPPINEETIKLIEKYLKENK
jgi:hypothetical protein